ncbi:MAG: hypothetical protein ACK53Y_09255, partial [bacterium]
IKLAPPYLQKQLQECAAFHVLAEMYELEPMKQADQHKFLFSTYHGIEKGTVSAVQLILVGEGPYAELWQTTTAAMELSIKLPGKLTTNSGDWYTKHRYLILTTNWVLKYLVATFPIKQRKH